MNEKTNASVAARPTPSAPALRVEAAVADDQRDGRAEEERLEDAGDRCRRPSTYSREWYQ